MMRLLRVWQKEIILMYHACVFILNRPVLYYVLYQDFEHLASSPSQRGYAERELESWVLNSCQACVESAKLIIHNLHQSCQQEFGLQERTGLNWNEVQLLTAAYAVLLSVQNATDFSMAFRDVARIDGLLNLADALLYRSSTASLGFQRTYEFLINIRQGFTQSSPAAAS